MRKPILLRILDGLFSTPRHKAKLSTRATKPVCVDELVEQRRAVIKVDALRRRRAAEARAAKQKLAESDWDDEIEGSDGRSPNDDRSDSMNPNNDAYQDSMDNRSDQMNPNNDAYHSSRR